MQKEQFTSVAESWKETLKKRSQTSRLKSYSTVEVDLGLLWQQRIFRKWAIEKFIQWQVAGEHGLSLKAKSNMPENLSSDWCVLLDSFEPIQTGSIANAISEITQISVFDATQKLAKSFGFLLENCTEDTAQKCVAALSSANIKAQVFPNKDLVQLPDPVEINKALFNPEGLSYFIHGSEMQFTAEWKNVALISTGVFLSLIHI